MNNNSINFIQQNSPDGGFLQSVEWRKFQEAVGRKTYEISGDDFYASIIEHKLPVVGKYFYIPRGPIISADAERISNFEFRISNEIEKIINLAKKENAGWIRIEPKDSFTLDLIRSNWRVVKAPHDMQPREILVMDITKSEEEILAQMKPKTRYNIKLAEKKGVKIVEDRKYTDEFIKLTKIMAKRQGISTHSDEYYQKMIEIIPGDMLKLYAAEYQGPASTCGDDRSSMRGGKIIAANLVVFYKNTCTYLHGASDDEYRSVMGPQLLQWRQIQDAKRVGCEKYDFGGIKSYDKNSWEGITRFKTGFAPNAKPIEFPGSYDIVITPGRYWSYRIIQKIKSII